VVVAARAAEQSAQADSSRAGPYSVARRRSAFQDASGSLPLPRLLPDRVPKRVPRVRHSFRHFFWHTVWQSAASKIFDFNAHSSRTHHPIKLRGRHPVIL
jgi:hypothetical protein